MTGPIAPPTLGEAQPLVDVLDKLLDTGVVLDGTLVLAVAGVDLVQVSLRALLASVDTAARLMAPVGRA
jgi:hypothetical protein